MKFSENHQKIVSSIQYPDFCDTSSFRNTMDSVKGEFYGNILNALDRFLGLSKLTEVEKKVWLIAITTRKHGLIYFMNRKEAQENLNFAFEHSWKIEKVIQKLNNREEKTRDIINYAFHEFVSNPKTMRLVDKRDNELVSYNGMHSVYCRKVAIRKNGSFDRELALFSYQENISNEQYYFDNDNDGCYDGHDLAHYIVALLGDYDFLDDDPKGSADHLPKALIDIFTNPANPFSSFVIFSHLLRPLFNKYYKINNEEETVMYMAYYLKEYLLGKAYLFDSKTNRDLKTDKPIDIVQLAVSIQAAIGEVPVSLAEGVIFTRGANSKRPEDMLLDNIDKSSVFERVYKIASCQMPFFQHRVIIRQKAQIAAYLLVAISLLENNQNLAEVELLKEMIYRIQNCYGSKIQGKNLYHRLYESGLLYDYGYSDVNP